MSDLTHRIDLLPAYDRTDEGYGRHGVDLRAYAIGDNRAVQFVLFTGWNHPDDKKFGWTDYLDIKFPHGPMPADLGYHSPVPLYEDQPSRDDCDVIDGPCFYDGSGLNAEPIFRVLCAEGTDGLWRELDAYYAETFRRVTF